MHEGRKRHNFECSDRTGPLNSIPPSNEISQIHLYIAGFPLVGVIFPDATEVHQPQKSCYWCVHSVERTVSQCRIEAYLLIELLYWTYVQLFISIGQLECLKYLSNSSCFYQTNIWTEPLVLSVVPKTPIIKD